MKTVMITGAAGDIGSVLRKNFQDVYPSLKLLDAAPLSALKDSEEGFQVDITDLDALIDACQGVDCLVHLAAIPGEDSWEKILPANIVGCHNVFEAARVVGVRRVVFASSNHAVGFHRREDPLNTDSLPRPDGYYGVSKVFGEALGRLYADKFGLEVVCLRIGSFRERPEDRRQLATWVSHRDMINLVRCCIDTEGLHYLVAYGVSANTRRNWYDDAADILGYVPKDNAESFADEILAADNKEDSVGGQFHGGPFCSIDFVGDVTKVD